MESSKQKTFTKDEVTAMKTKYEVDFDQITPCLYLGTHRASKSKDLHKALGIRGVLNVK